MISRTKLYGNKKGYDILPSLVLDEEEVYVGNAGHAAKKTLEMNAIFAVLSCTDVDRNTHLQPVPEVS